MEQPKINGKVDNGKVSETVELNSQVTTGRVNRTANKLVKLHLFKSVER